MKPKADTQTMMVEYVDMSRDRRGKHRVKFSDRNEIPLALAKLCGGAHNVKVTKIGAEVVNIVGKKSQPTQTIKARNIVLPTREEVENASHRDIVLLFDALRNYDEFREPLSGLTTRDGANKLRARIITVLLVAPWSTVDLATPDGSGITIEERPDREVTHVGPTRIAPEGIKVRNPAFDVTPHQFLTAIVTDRGVFRAPFGETLRAGAQDGTRAGQAESC